MTRYWLPWHVRGSAAYGTLCAKGFSGILELHWGPQRLFRDRLWRSQDLVVIGIPLPAAYGTLCVNGFSGILKLHRGPQCLVQTGSLNSNGDPVVLLGSPAATHVLGLPCRDWDPPLHRTGHSVQTDSLWSLNSIRGPNDSFGISYDVSKTSLTCKGSSSAAYGTPCATEAWDMEPLSDVYILNSLSAICLNKRNRAIILSSTSKLEFLSVSMQQRNSLVSSDIQGVIILWPIFLLHKTLGLNIIV